MSTSTGEWRMRVVLTLAVQERQSIEKLTDDGELMNYHVYHLDRAGLIQIASTDRSGNTRTYRLDIYGSLKGVFKTHADGTDALIYDKDSGYGRKNQAEAERDCLAMLERLEATFTEEEHQAYYF